MRLHPSRSGSYARFYSFTLSQQGDVQIDLVSDEDTYLYLLRGADANGSVVADNDDVESGNTDSRVTETLAPGTYTIEATTYDEGPPGVQPEHSPRRRQPHRHHLPPASIS